MYVSVFYILLSLCVFVSSVSNSNNNTTNNACLQCFDTVGRAAGRASGL